MRRRGMWHSPGERKASILNDARSHYFGVAMKALQGLGINRQLLGNTNHALLIRALREEMGEYAKLRVKYAAMGKKNHRQIERDLTEHHFGLIQAIEGAGVPPPLALIFAANFHDEVRKFEQINFDLPRLPESPPGFRSQHETGKSIYNAVMLPVLEATHMQLSVQGQKLEPLKKNLMAASNSFGSAFLLYTARKITKADLEARIRFVASDINNALNIAGISGKKADDFIREYSLRIRALWIRGV